MILGSATLGGQPYISQAAVAQQAQRTAVAESRQQMAASQAALEEQVLALQEEVARRDALQEQFGVEADKAWQHSGPEMIASDKAVFEQVISDGGARSV